MDPLVGMIVGMGLLWGGLLLAGTLARVLTRPFGAWGERYVDVVWVALLIGAVVLCVARGWGY